MEHLEIAYDLLVIMIGLAALSIVVFWAAAEGILIALYCPRI